MARSKVSKISLDKSIILFRLEVRPQKRFRNKLAIQSLSSGRIKNAVLKGQMIKSMTLVAQVDNYLGASTIQHLREQNIKHQNIGIRIGWLSENRLNHSSNVFSQISIHKTAKEHMLIIIQRPRPNHLASNK